MCSIESSKKELASFSAATFANVRERKIETMLKEGVSLFLCSDICQCEGEED